MEKPKKFKVRIMNLEKIENSEDKAELRIFVNDCLSKGIKITNMQLITQKVLEW